MNVEFNRIERSVGVFVIGISVLLMIMVIIIGRGKDWFENSIIYYTTFDESYNLKEGSAVKLSKADIGKINKITLVKDKVKIKLSILEKYSSRIRQNTFAIVDSPTFIGSEYISILPGRQSAPLIPPKGEIASKAKRTLTDFLAEFEVEKTAKMVVTAVQEIAGLVDEIREPKGPFFSALKNINKTAINLEKITGEMQAGYGSAGAFLKSRELVDSIFNKLDSLGEILESIKIASQKAPLVMDKVGNNLDIIKDVGGGLNQRVVHIKKILDEVSVAVETLKEILNNLKQGSAEVPVVIHSTNQGIDEIRDGVENIDKVVKSLQNNFLIHPNLPPEPVGQNTDAGLRE